MLSRSNYYLVIGVTVIGVTYPDRLRPYFAPILLILIFSLNKIILTCRIQCSLNRAYVLHTHIHIGLLYVFLPLLQRYMVPNKILSHYLDLTTKLSRSPLLRLLPDM